MKSLWTDPEASTELEEAALWYEEKRDGFGLEFLNAVDVALEFVTGFSHAGSPVPFVPNDVPVRRVPVKRFPFHIVYLELSAEIRIIAFAHDRRRPRYWLSRV